MPSSDTEMDFESAFSRLRHLRSSVDHRPWRPGMPMERALEALGETLRELRRSHREIDRLRVEVRALRAERNAAERTRSELSERIVDVQKGEAIARVAGSVAHDFNNLILIVTGRAELLLEQLGEGHPYRKHAREIRRAGRRASVLARQLLEFSRPTRRQGRQLDANAALEGMREMLETVVGRSIALSADLGREPGAIEIDRGELEQLVLNLAVNARDAMPAGGTLHVETRREDLRESDARTGWAAPGSFVVISVSDSGIGMDSATRARIFEPYFSTKEAGRGTGLGLPSAQAISRRYGGWISVTSTPGQGSRFDVYLPRARAGCHADARPPDASGRASRQPR